MVKMLNSMRKDIVSIKMEIKNDTVHQKEYIAGKAED